MGYKENLQTYVEGNLMLDQIKDQMKDMLQAVKETDEYILLENELQAVQSIVAVVEEKLQAEIILEYRKTGNKKPFAGAGIQERKVVEYDVDLVRAWALHNMPSVLDLNKTKFEKVAKTIPAEMPKFVHVKEEPIATLANLEKLQEIVQINLLGET